ncbi:MAG: sigma-54-dependent Fis family transcriptional regulator [Robiginitomaculum sp.]|nr:sigma-54-dependent Fis family transcriptional regulator [Robiginitomaculum sp.]
MTKTILIVDDDPTQRRLMQAVVEKQGFVAAHADSGEAAVEAITSCGNIDVILLDLVMPGMGGMKALAEIRDRVPHIPVIVQTGQGGIETVVKAMQVGAADFFVKPVSPERLLVSLRNVMKVGELEGEVVRLRKTATGALTFGDMIASAPVMHQVVRLGERAAKSNIPILVLGESGVGKELVARAIHGASARAGKPMITVNCGALPENLVESILFGHEKGAFTGAIDKHKGKFREADGGTLFLDEVGDLPMDMQVKLLRALQEGEIDPVGAKRSIKVNVRIISATNRDLTEDVANGKFREDLFYRLNVFPLEVPPLRDRMEDLPELTRHFIGRFNAQEGTHISGVTAKTMGLLKRFDWPGNVRQLENAVFRAVVLCEGNELEAEDFPHISGITRQISANSDEEALVVAQQAPEASEGPVAINDDPVHITNTAGHIRALEEIERDLIEFAINAYAGHMSEIARRLGIGRSTLYRKVKEHDLDSNVEKVAS